MTRKEKMTRINRRRRERREKKRRNGQEAADREKNKEKEEKNRLLTDGDPNANSGCRLSTMKASTFLCSFKLHFC